MPQRKIQIDEDSFDQYSNTSKLGITTGVGFPLSSKHETKAVKREFINSESKIKMNRRSL